MAGINRALISGYDRIIYENKVIQNNSKVCVFTSFAKLISTPI